MKKFLCGVAGALPVLASSVVALAEDAVGAVTTPSIVTVNDIQSTIVDAIRPWIAAGLGIGIAVFCIYLGWRLIKRFTR